MTSINAYPRSLPPIDDRWDDDYENKLPLQALTWTLGIMFPGKHPITVRIVAVSTKYLRARIWEFLCLSYVVLSSFLINCMKKGPSWQAGSPSASQKIYHLLWEQKVYYRVHKIPPIDNCPEPDESNQQPDIQFL